jgi:hypothetical protein
VRIDAMTSNQPPSVSLTMPNDGATFVAPATITITADASDGDGAVSRVDFYNGSTLIASDATSPYEITWSDVPSGTYSLTAAAIDDDGASTTSAPRTVTVSAAANQPPSVSLTQPMNGASYTAPATIAISADAADTDGTIARVDFYQGSTLIGSDTSAPYSGTWSNVSAGTYSLTAVAIDNGGASTTSAPRTVTVNGSTNQPPAVALTVPANGATYTAPAHIGIAANASDADGTIARVDFYQGSTLIASDTTSPYIVAWHNVPAGTYSLTAVATDNGGASTTSAPRTVTVNGASNQPPSVSLTAPANGATYTAPASITISVTATDTDGTIARVDFYQGSTQIGSDTSQPYGMNWTNVPPGTYSLTAVATDDDGGSTTSAARTITVNPSPPTNLPPSVSLTDPPDGATYLRSATVTLAATASDEDGTIARVDFYAGTTVIGSDNSAPYSVTWSSGAAGDYSLTAVAIDNVGASTTSSARSVTIVQTGVVFGPSTDHGTLVTHYVLEIFAEGADPSVATPVASQNLGKPPVINGECTADVTATIANLAPGNYQVTVSAVGSGGSSRSAPAPFTR